jgi:hypothetical protein
MLASVCPIMKIDKKYDVYLIQFAVKIHDNKDTQLTEDITVETLLYEQVPYHFCEKYNHDQCQIN